MAANDVLLNKAATIERCVTRIRTERGRLVADEIAQTVEDSVVLNIQRACEASIDAAMHVVRVRELGIPQDRRA
jgi:regulator of protease activity HflC (stomatin/prohibitin superfamily)